MQRKNSHCKGGKTLAAWLAKHDPSSGIDR
jgi:hypothetical protein